MDLALLIFLITLGVEVTGWIGKEALVGYAFPLTTLFSSSPHAKQSRLLKSEVLKLKAELAATSSQDEFAKWAKLRRKSDKAIADLEQLNASVVRSRAAFATKFNSLLWILTTVLPFIVSSWHRKEAVFYLPQGWFGPAAWPMGLPSAPAGAIACGIWTMVCKRFLGVLKACYDDLTSKEAEKVPIAVEVPVEASPISEKEL